MHLRGLYFDADTKKSVTGTICGPAENASLIGIQLAECLKNADRDLTEEMKFSAGKVWLVGAGPSDPGLMTVRGSGVLSRADTVVFDSLVGTEILNMCEAAVSAYRAGADIYLTYYAKELAQCMRQRTREYVVSVS